MTRLMFCIGILLIALPGFGGSTSGKANACDPGIIGRIQEGKSSKKCKLGVDFEENGIVRKASEGDVAGEIGFMN